MDNTNQDPAKDETERLRNALDAETLRCLAAERHLARASADFEEFVSMAAHNLRESLRDVASFSQLMAETWAGRLDSDADMFLERIQEGASRMQLLLADVVDYWATGTGGRQPAPTDMEVVLVQALLREDQRMKERSAMVTHDRLPAVMGDSEMLARVLHHLIHNAIEYCDEPSPRVHISCKPGDSGWVFSVKDNGPGVDVAFQDRIFGVFKRLHGKEHPGNGLGLAFCKKVIEWHGGGMSMESTPGAGSTFYFTLPPAD
jgi:light-regulated signal transduction histidine kinase (bacteriophytochrome)